MVVGSNPTARANKILKKCQNLKHTSTKLSTKWFITFLGPLGKNYKITDSSQINELTKLKEIFSEAINNFAPVRITRYAESIPPNAGGKFEESVCLVD